MNDIKDNNTIIQIKGLNKWYGDFHVLKNINLEVKKRKKSLSADRPGQENPH